MSINHLPPPPPAAAESPQNPNPPNLKSTLSTLKTLIHLSSESINLLSPLSTIIPCPLIPHHHIPPSSSFFYLNCPSVVSLPDPPSHPPFTLPPFFSTSPPHPFSHSSLFRFLPSDFMFLLTETHAWNHYPLHYSFIIRRLFFCLASCGTQHELFQDLSTWIIVNSPRYGLIIDVSVRDHVLLLLRFCLRPIVTEAIALSNGDEFYFNCPVLCQVLEWYGTQLSILFGEINGKLFAIHLFKHLVLNLTIKFLMFSGETSDIITNDFFTEGEISVSQVQEAVAAFRDRSLLEEKIKAVRYSRQLNSSQQMAEHGFISKRAEEERHKRSDFKPIIEHDLFSWQRGRNKDTSVTKTKEELLAEERDYKRRRMSYRGKKIKRTTTQVMRDIIEEYTEEIKAAGGFGHLQHVAEGSGKAASDSLPVCNISADNVMAKGLTNSSDVGTAPTYNRRESHSYKETRSTKIADQYPNDFDEFKPNQKADTNRYDKNYNSRSLEKLRDTGRTGRIELSSVRGQLDVTEVRKKSSRRSPERNYSFSDERSRHRKEQINGSEGKSRRERSLGRSRRSDSVGNKKFQDRYDPSES
ncbi:hypothetical protein AgCh_031832 [Apium graveolens]